MINLGFGYPRPRYNVIFDACLSDSAVSNYALTVHFASLLLDNITFISFKGHAIVFQKCMMTKDGSMGALPCQI